MNVRAENISSSLVILYHLFNVRVGLKCEVDDDCQEFFASTM